MKTFILKSTLLLTLLISGCDVSNDDDECIVIRNEFITTVTAPATAAVNQTTNIEVTFQAGNGCGQFRRFIENSTGLTTQVTLEAIYDGCVCTADAPIRTVNYPFTPNTAGTYELNFRSGTTSFITATIVVN